MKIPLQLLILCPYPSKKAPSQRFRFEQYFEVIDVNYCQVGFWNEDEWPRIYKSGSIKYKVLSTMRGFGRRLRLLLKVSQYDKVFIHREATPIGPPWFEWAVAKVLRKPIIFDFDDAIWLPNSSKANEKLAGKLKFHGKTAKICSWATTVVAGNDFLADYAKQYCEDVRVIPTTIDTEKHHNPDLYVRVGSKWVKKGEAVLELLADSRWPLADQPESHNFDSKIGDGGKNPDAKKDEQKLPQSPKGREQLIANSQKLAAHSKTADENEHQLITIGWTGTHSTLKQLTPLFPVLEEVYQTHPFRFLLIADVPPISMPDFVEFRKWRKETEIEDLLEIEIGVMPLYGTDWERGKCGFKAIQYSALGIPAVVSSVGVNQDIILNDISGFVAEEMASNKDFPTWKEKLSKLIESKGLRQKMGAMGRKRVVMKYAVQSNEQKYRKLFLV